jgi:hypothetical protein
MICRQSAPSERAKVYHSLWWQSLLLLLAMLWSVASPTAQPSPPLPLSVRLDEAARSFGNNSSFKRLSEQQRRSLAEFVGGNTLFAMLHELGHTAIGELQLPVLGREEDAADDFAVLRLLKVGTNLSHRMLVEAAKGWFLSDRRDRREGDELIFYDRHGLDQQRAYQIVCLTVGSQPSKFSDLANETQLPKGRQQGCKSDYAKTSQSWDMLLKPHRRATGQPTTPIAVVYSQGEGKLADFENGFRKLGLLERVAAHLEDELAWPEPFTLEMQSCGVINAQWVPTIRKLLLCYELAADFAELYSDFNEVPAQKKKRSSRSRRHS